MKGMIWRSGLTTVLLIGLSGMGWSTGFSLSSLNGTCVWQATFLPTTSGDSINAGPAAVLATLTFDGNGHVTFSYDANINGTFTSTAVVNGTYTVDSSGHGSLSYVSPASGANQTYVFHVSPHGKTIQTIISSYNGQPLAPRVSTGVCRFDE